jgi:translocation and assembly module TamB
LAHPSEHRPRSLRFRLAAALIIGFLGIAALAVSFFLLTEPGLRFIAHRAFVLVPGELNVEEVEGRLVGPVHLRGIRYADGDLEVQASSLGLDISPLFLLAARIQITRVDIGGLTVRLPPPAVEKPPVETTPPDIRLPLAVRLEEGALEGLTIHPAEGAPIFVERISLSGSIDRQGLTLRHLGITAGSLEVTASGRILPEQEVPIQALLDWSYRNAEPPAFTGEMTVTGDWENITARHRLSSPFPADLLVRLRSPLH